MRGEHAATHTGSDPAGDDELVDLVPVQHRDQPGSHARPHLGHEWSEWGRPGASDDVKPRQRVPCSGAV